MIINAETVRNLSGAWQMMIGRAEGLRSLDLSADGFWNSFFAMIVAAPALALGWSTIAGDIAGETGASRAAILLRLALVDVGAWVLPLLVLAAFARPAGISDRFVPYVVATNWGSAIIVWLMLPSAILRLVAPSAVEAASLLSLALFGVSLFFTWRLTNLSIARGPAMATAVFAAMFCVSLMVLFALQGLLGLSASP